MRSIRLALDWTPNINHLGVYIARTLGYYDDAGLEVEIISPKDDTYALTSAKKVELGLADVAFCPSESVLSYHTKKNPFPLIAIAAIYQKDLSAIAVRNFDGLKSPKDLDHKTYASYGARYEDAIVKQMIINDGGSGTFKLIMPNSRMVSNNEREEKADFSWIFLNWEGVIDDFNEDKFRFFKMEDYGIPYSYSPLLVSSQYNIDYRKKDLSKFLKVTAEGYLFLKDNPLESKAVLNSIVEESLAKYDVAKAIAMTAEVVKHPKGWGYMDEFRFTSFFKWLDEKGIQKLDLKVNDLFTNELL